MRVGTSVATLRDMNTPMKPGRVVSDEEWLAARKELLAQEKEYSRARDRLTRLRAQMPWRRIAQSYTFDTVNGPRTLAELFDGRSQLIVYHFMFDPSWEEGCKSCSFIADHYDRAIVHLRHRDVSLVTVSRAPLEKLQAFRKRIGWSFPWVSSHGNTFNADFHVSFTPEETASGKAYYNYVEQSFPAPEAPGASVFARGDGGEIYHTYSCFSRALETFIGAYHWLDLVPKGRDESQLAYGMEWVRHHDRYEDAAFLDPYKDQPGKHRKR